MKPGVGASKDVCGVGASTADGFALQDGFAPGVGAFVQDDDAGPLRAGVRPPAPKEDDDGPP